MPTSEEWVTYILRRYSEYPLKDCMPFILEDIRDEPIQIQLYVIAILLSRKLNN